MAESPLSMTPKLDTTNNSIESDSLPLSTSSSQPQSSALASNTSLSSSQDSQTQDSQTQDSQTQDSQTRSNRVSNPSDLLSSIRVPSSSRLSVVTIWKRLGIQSKMMGMAIAISILPVLILGVSTYAIANNPNMAELVAGLVGISTKATSYQQFALLTLFAAIGTAGTVGLLSAYWVRRTLQPVLDSIAVVRAISEGNLEARMPIHGIDELAHLGQSINHMVDQIQDLLREREAQTQRLQELNGALEGRVKQRTNQLSGVINQLKQEVWERKQAEMALQQSQVKLIHSEKMSGLGQMVAGIAHEINNPVNFIHGNLKHVQTHVQEILSILELYQSLYPEPLPELQAIADDLDIDFLAKDVRKVVASMQIGTNRILDIVRSLRTFSRMDQVEFKSVDIHEGIESTLLILKHRLKAHSGRPQILVVKQYDEKLPLVDCQAGQINQVLMNILANAIDALDEAGDLCIQKSEPPMIIISTQQVDADYITIQLSDNGPGIPMDVQKRLFDPFFTTKPVGQGTGLGMSISHTIITENHGGRLKLVSTSGQGASFLIELPIKQRTSN